MSHPLIDTLIKVRITPSTLEKFDGNFKFFSAQDNWRQECQEKESADHLVLQGNQISRYDSSYINYGVSRAIL